VTEVAQQVLRLFASHTKSEKESERQETNNKKQTIHMLDKIKHNYHGHNCVDPQFPIRAAGVERRGSLEFLLLIHNPLSAWYSLYF
jgi:hypothetical protein